MLKKPEFHWLDSKSGKVTETIEHDFYRYTKFNPIGLENLLNLSFEKYFSIEGLIVEDIERSKKLFGDYFEQFKSIIQDNKKVNEICLKKIQYIALYKLNWNIPQNVLDNLNKILLYGFHFFFPMYFIRGNTSISPVTYNFFIKSVFPDIFIVFLSNIMYGTSFGNTLTEKGYINFFGLPKWLLLFKKNILDINIEFDEFQKGLLWNNVIDNNRFIWHLTYRDKDIAELINNEVYFGKYLGIIERAYNEKQFKNKIRDLKLKVLDQKEIIKNYGNLFKFLKEENEYLNEKKNTKKKDNITPLQPFSEMKDLEWHHITITMGYRYENEIHISTQKGEIKCTYKELCFKSPNNKTIELMKLFCNEPNELTDKFIKQQLNIKSKTSRKTVNDFGHHFRKLFCIDENPYRVERIKIPKTVKYSVQYIPSIKFKFDKRIREYLERKPSHTQYNDELITKPENYLKEKEQDAEEKFRYFTEGDET